MLTSRSCPHTGIVNYYLARDPFLAVGSVQRLTGRTAAWRCHIGDHTASGVARDRRSAEQELNAHLRIVACLADETRVPAAA